MLGAVVLLLTLYTPTGQVYVQAAVAQSPEQCLDAGPRIAAEIEAKAPGSSVKWGCFRADPPGAAQAKPRDSEVVQPPGSI